MADKAAAFIERYRVATLKPHDTTTFIDPALVVPGKPRNTITTPEPQKNCAICGTGKHPLEQCSRVSAVEYYPTGGLKRIEFARDRSSEKAAWHPLPDPQFS